MLTSEALAREASKSAQSKEMQVADLAQRNASLDDMKELWALMRHAAADIPCSIESESDQERAR